MQFNDYQLTCYCKHFFSNSIYLLTIHNYLMSLANPKKPDRPKYQVNLTWDTKISFKLGQNKVIEAFGFVTFKKKLKWFYAEPHQITILREVLSKKASFTQIKDFYDPKVKIANGSNSEVFQVTRLRDNNDAFISKCIHKQEINQLPYGIVLKFKSLQNELLILTALDHPGIPKLVEVFQGEGTYYIIMEQSKGASLNHLIKNTQRSLSMNLVRMIMRDILEIIAYLHSRSVVHANLSPSHIFVHQEENKLSIQVLAFGDAIRLNEQPYCTQVRGTAGYIAPEILNSGDTKYFYDQKTDIFSIGTVFYKLLTRRDLFTGQNAKETYALNKRAQFAISHLQLARVPPCALQLLGQLLERDPDKRLDAVSALKHAYFSEDLNASNSQRRFKSHQNFQRVKQIVGDSDLNVEYFSQELPPTSLIPIMGEVKGGNRSQFDSVMGDGPWPIQQVPVMEKIKGSLQSEELNSLKDQFAQCNVYSSTG